MVNVDVLFDKGFDMVNYKHSGDFVSKVITDELEVKRMFELFKEDAAQIEFDYSGVTLTLEMNVNQDVFQYIFSNADWFTHGSLTADEFISVVESL